jgi:hypothetical protein
MKNGNIAQMSCPQGKKINQDDRQNILETIKKIASKKIKNIDIGVIYDIQEQNTLKNFYKEEIQEITKQLVSKKNPTSLNLDVLKEQSEYFEKKFFKEAHSLVDSSPFIRFLSPLSKRIYEQSLKEMDQDLLITQKQIMTKIKLLESETQIANLRKKREGDHTTKLIEARIAKIYQYYEQNQQEIETKEVVYNHMDPTRRMKWHSNGGGMTIYSPKAGWFPTLKEELKAEIDEIKNKQSSLEGAIGGLQGLKSKYICGDIENVSSEMVNNIWQEPSSCVIF